MKKVEGRVAVGAVLELPEHNFKKVGEKVLPAISKGLKGRDTFEVALPLEVEVCVIALVGAAREDETFYELSQDPLFLKVECLGLAQLMRFRFHSVNYVISRALSQTAFLDYNDLFIVLKASC